MVCGSLCGKTSHVGVPWLMEFVGFCDVGSWVFPKGLQVCGHLGQSISWDHHTQEDFETQQWHFIDVPQLFDIMGCGQHSFFSPGDLVAAAGTSRWDEAIHNRLLHVGVSKNISCHQLLEKIQQPQAERIHCGPSCWWHGWAPGTVSASRYVMIYTDKIRQAISWFSYWAGFRTLDVKTWHGHVGRIESVSLSITWIWYDGNFNMSHPFVWSYPFVICFPSLDDKVRRPVNLPWATEATNFTWL